MDGENAAYIQRNSEIEREVLNETIRRNELKRRAANKTPSADELKAGREEMMAATLRRLMRDPIVQDHMINTEGPAIAFENLIAARLNEPSRATDYFYSSGFDSSGHLITEDNSSNVLARRSGRDPQTIRSDVAPKAEKTELS